MRGEAVGYHIRCLPCQKRRSIVDNGLDTGQDLGPQSGVIEGVYEKSERNFDGLIFSLARSIRLRMIGRTIEKLDS